MGSIPTVRRVLAAAYEVTSEMSRSYYLLPRDWDLGDFTLADFEKVNNAIRAVVYGWLYATDLAHSADDSYVRDIPFKLKRVELISAIKDVTGLTKRVVTDIVSLLTYARDAACRSDPALQPLLAISNDEFLLSSTLVLGGSPERNLIALLNTRPADRARYDRLKNQKEALMRTRLEERRPSYCESWHGRIPGRKDLPDVDYALFDERTKTLLVAELKWFVAPDEPRELSERSEDIGKGVRQCKLLLDAFEYDPFLIHDLGRVSDVTCIVVSANSIGMSFVQDAAVPVINEDHLLEELACADSLAEVVSWLRDRHYLPQEGVDYVSVDPIIPFFAWDLEWYGFAPLASGDFLPLSKHRPT